MNTFRKNPISKFPIQKSELQCSYRVCSYKIREYVTNIVLQKFIKISFFISESNCELLMDRIRLQLVRELKLFKLFGDNKEMDYKRKVKRKNYKQSFKWNSNLK